MNDLLWKEFLTQWCENTEPPFSEEQFDRAINALKKITPDLLAAILASPSRNIFSAIHLVQLGLLLDDCASFPRFQQVLHRLIKGENAALSELRIARAFRQVGFGVELEPPLKGRVLDCLIRLASSEIYCEVVTPERSKVFSELQQMLYSIAEELSQKHAGWKVEVNFTEEPTKNLINIVRRTLATDCEVLEQIHGAQLKKTRPRAGETFDTGSPPGFFKGPSLNVCMANCSKGVSSGAITRACFSDGRAKRFLSAESKQLSRGVMNIIVIDCSNISGGFVEWQQVLRRALTPERYTRISAILLYAYHQYVAGVKEQYAIINNNHASLALPESIIHCLEKLGVAKETN